MIEKKKKETKIRAFQLLCLFFILIFVLERFEKK